MYIQSRWYIQPFSTSSLMWCSTKNWSWQLSKDKNVSFPPPYQVWHICFWPWLTERSLHSNIFERGFNWTRSWTYFFQDDLKCIRRQYGLRHCVTGCIHGAIGDTYNRMVILVSNIEKLFSLWDRCQLIIILSWTRIMKNTIFVGPKNETISGLKNMLTQRTQWCNYIEELMRITNFNPNNNSESLASLNWSSFPFRICDISLTQDQTGSVYFLK